MADFKQCIIWLKEGKKVRRPSWEKDSYWILGIEESIQWANRMHAHIHLNQIEASDWEIYEYKYVEPEALKSFINPVLIPKEFSFGVACKKCGHFHPVDMVGFDVLYNCSECDASLFEKKLDERECRINETKFDINEKIKTAMKTKNAKAKKTK